MIDYDSPYAPSPHPRDKYSPFTAPPTEAPSRCYRDGDLLVARRVESLPPRCVKCGATANERLTQKLHWYPKWVIVLAVLSPLVFLIVSLVVRKKAVLEVGLCTHHARARRRARLVGWLLIAAAVPASIAVDAGIGPLLATLLFFGGFMLILVLGRTVVAKKMDDNFVWLHGVHRSVLDTLRPTL